MQTRLSFSDIAHNLLHILLLELLWRRGLAACGHKGEYEEALVSLCGRPLGLSERLGDKIFQMSNPQYPGLGVRRTLQPGASHPIQSGRSSRRRTSISDPEIIRNAEINLGDYYLLRGDLRAAHSTTLKKFTVDSQQRGKWGEEWMKWRYMQHCCHSLGELWLAKGDAEKALAVC